MAQEMLFGFCYMPQIIRVEDFSPYWVLDRWSRERTLEDLKIMRAIGTGCLRVHITPPVPGATAYDRLGDRRTVPITGEKYLELTDLIVKTAHELGIKVHFDIGSSLSEVSESSLNGWIPRYRGLVESYQFANENYASFASDQAEGTAGTYERYIRLLRLARGLDPDAKFTADIFTEQIEYARSRFPGFYDGLDVLNTHPYYCTDHQGWTEEWIRALVATHTPNTPWPADVPWVPEKVTLARFHGIANLGKGIWVTETAATGDGWWSALVQDETEAECWRKGIHALASCDLLTRVYWCWFTDKMHTVEAGVTQAGAVSYDGRPTPLTYAFRELAEQYAPADSIVRHLRIRIDDVRVDSSDTQAALKLSIENRSQRPIAGHAALELPEGVRSSFAPFEFNLQPGQGLAREVAVQIGSLPETHNHLFLRVEASGQIHYGWGMVVRPRPLALDADEVGLPGVQYRPGTEAVQEFLSQYGDRCAIVVGPGSGHWDVELGFRIKIILEALCGTPVPIKTWFMISEVWDRPLIIVGRPTLNFIAQLVEMGLPPDQKADAMEAGQGFIQVVERPLGEPVGQWSTDPRERLIGFRRCPAALYIAGGDDDGTRKATYDLIKRLWHPKGAASPRAWWV